MSVLQRMLPCPCRTWRCRAIYAAHLLALAAGIGAGLVLDVRFGWL